MVTLKVLFVPESLSNRARKEIDGLSAKLHGVQINEFPVYLIGQLGRNSNVAKERMPGSELLQYAFDIIANAVDAVGGRCVLVECKPVPELEKFYQNNDFIEISRIPDEDHPMIQLLKNIS